jgi:hypothetical protein
MCVVLVKIRCGGRSDFAIGHVTGDGRELDRVENGSDDGFVGEWGGEAERLERSGDLRDEVEVPKTTPLIEMLAIRANCFARAASSS